MKHFIFLILCTLTPPALSFNIDGFQSGMTVEELKGYALRQNLDFRTIEHSQKSFKHLVGNFKKYEIQGAFISCQGLVVAYEKTIDPEIAHANIAEAMLKQHGQPKFTLERTPIYQRPGLYGTTLKLSWYTGSDRITLSENPELRDGQGNIIFRRHADIEYTTKNNCMKEFQ